MPIPDFQELMLPLLKATADGNLHKTADLKELLAKEFDLSDEERRELLPSGTQSRFDNRVIWAKTYLAKSLLLDTPKRAHVAISDRGRGVLANPPEKIDRSFLMQYKEFVEFISPNNKVEEAVKTVEQNNQTPKEKLEEAHQQIKRMLISQLQDVLSDIDPYKFEQLVIDLLQAIGYGGNRAEAAQVTKKSADGGIDGIINEDRLGLDKIYIQAKRYNNPVPIREVRDFGGAMLAHNARKGVFITTSEFPESARDYAQNIDRTLILIDGKRLAELMIEYNIGISPKETFVYKEIDSDYFEN